MDQIFLLPYPYLHLRILADVKKYSPKSDTDTDQILADLMRILIIYVKLDMVTNKLNGYTYITFYLIYNNIKCDTDADGKAKKANDAG